MPAPCLVNSQSSCTTGFPLLNPQTFSRADVESFILAQPKYNSLFFMGSQACKLEAKNPFLPPLENLQVLGPFIFLNTFDSFY